MRPQRSSAGEGAYGQKRAGEVRGGITAQESGEGDYILGLAEPSTRIGSSDPGNMLVVRVGAHARCVGESRCQGHRADSLICQLLVDHVGKYVHACLGGSIDAGAWACLHADHAADVDDPSTTAADHDRGEVLGRKEAAT